MRHDRDAGGSPEVRERKDELRERVWGRLEDEGASRFPGARGRIPNFTGAEEAAARLARTEPWGRAGALKANPDSPQWPVRQRALEEGRTVYMAVPKLADERPFLLLDPDEIEASPRAASSIKGAGRSARPVHVDELAPLDAVVTGCVAASADGTRLGKGGGFSDLEFAVAREAGLVGPRTPVMTTVHELQVVDEGEIPMTDHDIVLDVIATPERVVEVDADRDGPAGVDWSLLSEEKIRSIPLLQRLRREAGAGG